MRKELDFFCPHCKGKQVGRNLDELYNSLMLGYDTLTYEVECEDCEEYFSIHYKMNVLVETSTEDPDLFKLKKENEEE